MKGYKTGGHMQICNSGVSLVLSSPWNFNSTLT
uniref:Uncharacterized protein n=1 Tax=Setaria italica TaxID=4555 RepID=K3ZG41_SETIT